MFVVGYLYNSNGMATWCWEAAHSLKAQGKNVILLASDDVDLPAHSEVEIIRLPPEKKVRSAFRRELSRLSVAKLPIVARADKHLRQRGITPRAYFLNQTNLFDETISAPQFVVAWTYPTSFLAYWRKIFRITGGRLSAKVALDTMGWWRKDWQTYHRDVTMIAVSQRLSSELQSKGVNSRLVHPGTDVARYISPASQRSLFPDRKVKVMVASLKLEEPRKRVLWLLDALQTVDPNGFELYLYGRASDQFQASLKNYRYPIHYMGYHQREKLQAVIPNHDIFLFGSRIDDWGYVLVEAMANGLAVLAPDLSPFDEIVGDAGQLYSLESKEDFAAKFEALRASDLDACRAIALDRARSKFSREIFGRQLLDVFESGQPSPADCVSC